MPKLWSETVEAHRREVRDAALDATAAIVAEKGVLGVTMSRIAAQTGIGRATLYKYFPDADAILRAWHERQIARHLGLLADVASRDGDARERLQAVLHTYARLSHGSRRRHENALAALLHQLDHVAHAERELRDMISGVLLDAVRVGEIRDDVPPDELAEYCLNALGAAQSLASRAAVDRLVEVTLTGLRPQT